MLEKAKHNIYLYQATKFSQDFFLIILHFTKLSKAKISETGQQEPHIL